MEILAGNEEICENSGTMRKNYQTGTGWEPVVGYSRAVRVAFTIEVSGTVAVENGEPYAPGDAYEQTKKILEIIRNSVESLGGMMEHIVRTRIYTTDISKWAEIGKAHREVFETISPATSMIQVNALIAPEYLVEIEATAIVT